MRPEAQQSYENYAAGFVCFCGFALHLLLSDPLLNALGIHYSGTEGHFYEKIHPGTLLYFLAFLILLCRGNPLARFLALCRQDGVFMALLVLYVLLFFYMAARSGFAGLAFILDTHMSAVICALVFTHAPAPLCRRLVHFFVAFSLLNGFAGIVEAWGQFRIFTFDPDWVVLHEEHFRASAFLGHPLDNALFTAVALFVALGFDYSRPAKAVIAAILLAALIAFGGRAAFAVSIFSLALLCAITLWKRRVDRSVTVSQLSGMLAAGMAVPLCIGALFYFLTCHGIGQHMKLLTAWDASADSRRLAFHAFSFMKGSEILFGIPAQRIVDIAWRMHLAFGVDGIENPWVMMCMSLGVITFLFWLAATIAFIFKLVENKPVALQLAVLAYFFIATASNSFGRKDAAYAIMASAVIGASRALTQRL